VTFFRATTQLRWAKYESPGGYDITLQQEWVGDDGTVDWRAVPIALLQRQPDLPAPVTAETGARRS
jgi:hypothetical protein